MPPPAWTRRQYWATSAQRRCHPEEALYLPAFSHLFDCRCNSRSLSLSSFFCRANSVAPSAPPPPPPPQRFSPSALRWTHYLDTIVRVVRVLCACVHEEVCVCVDEREREREREREYNIIYIYVCVRACLCVCVYIALALALALILARVD